MTVREAIITLNANVVFACGRAGFCSATVRMVEDALDTIEDALKAQEPRVMTLYEVAKMAADFQDCMLWFEPKEVDDDMWFMSFAQPVESGETDIHIYEFGNEVPIEAKKVPVRQDLALLDIPPDRRAEGGDTVELKPCPFCGGDVKIIFRSASMMNMVYHKDGGNGCYIAGPFKIPTAKAHSLKEAAEAWNRRANDETSGD